MKSKRLSALAVNSVLRQVSLAIRFNRNRPITQEIVRGCNQMRVFKNKVFKTGAVILYLFGSIGFGIYASDVGTKPAKPQQSVSAVRGNYPREAS